MTIKRRSGRTLTRGALRNAIYNCCPGLSRAAAAVLCETVFEEMAAALEQGEPVKLHGFGRFHVREKRARVGRNPKTGVETAITPRRVLSFRPSPVLLARLNGGTIADP